MAKRRNLSAKQIAAGFGGKRSRRSRAGSIGRKVSRKSHKLLNSHHIADVVGGAGYALVEKFSAPLVGSLLPGIPLGLKQALIAYGLTMAPGVLGDIGHAGLTVEAYSAAAQFSQNLPLLGGIGGSADSLGGWS